MKDGSEMRQVSISWLHTYIPADSSLSIKMTFTKIKLRTKKCSIGKRAIQERPNFTAFVYDYGVSMIKSVSNATQKSKNIEFMIQIAYASISQDYYQYTRSRQ